jgi:hypothetical protein
VTPRKRLFIAMLFLVAGLISVVYVSVETNPEIIVPGRVVGYNVEAAGDYAYVSNNDGVVIIDKSDHSAPLRVGTIPLRDGARGMAIEGAKLYIAGTEQGLVIVDISAPVNPVVLGNVTMGIAYNVFVVGSMAYLVTVEGALGIVDVSNASSPSVLGALVVGSRGTDVAVAGDIAYYACPDSGLVLVNVSSPSSPEIIKTQPSTQGAMDICIHEETLYLGCHGGGLKIFNISSAEDPIWLSSFDDGGEVWGVSPRRR